jgi:hypothetical protein
MDVCILGYSIAHGRQLFMNRRRNEGEETFRRLLAFTKGQAAAERLTAQLLIAEGFKSVDPSHPLGGPDGLKDIICVRDEIQWIGAAYIPNGKQTFHDVKAKFCADIQGVAHNRVAGFAFVTNQELSLGQRRELEDITANAQVDILHLERIATRLPCYGIRLEFLDIEMTKDEQLSFIAEHDKVLHQLKASFDALARDVRRVAERPDISVDEQGIAGVLKDIREFQTILNSIAGNNPYGFPLASSYITLGAAGGSIHSLKVPLEELREFAAILKSIAGTSAFTGLSNASFSSTHQGHVSQLYIPLDNLREYEERLDRIIVKLREKSALESTAPVLRFPPTNGEIAAP